MSQIDERALEAAATCRASLEICLDSEDWDDHLPYLDGWHFHVEYCRRIIEAYEAAKPDPWRRIEEAAGLNAPAILKQDGLGKPNYIYVEIITDSQDTYFQYDAQGTWTIEGWPRDAMFRTIDPPPQDAVSRATSTPPAAEASS